MDARQERIPERGGQPQALSDFLTDGKIKGKCPILTNFQDVTRTARNEILPLMKQLGPNDEPPSGKGWAGIKATAKQVWWDKWSQDRARLKGKEMPPTRAEPNGGYFLALCLVGWGLQISALVALHSVALSG
mmetsp:Transcript_88/g.280  ORF Transcript_88/g.280 Transcript_88/m.280 type:complete len:132 (-) Transcript_88:406-801(-)